MTFSSSAATKIRKAIEHSDNNVNPDDLFEAAMARHAQLDNIKSDYSNRDSNIQAIFLDAVNFLQQKHGFPATDQRFNPTWIFAILAEVYRPTTAFNYSWLIVHRLQPKFFVNHTSDTKRILEAMNRMKNITPKENAATPATVDQVRRIIGPRTTRHQQRIWLMFISAARHADLDGMLPEVFTERATTTTLRVAVRIKSLWCKNDQSSSLQMSRGHRPLLLPTTCPAATLDNNSRQMEEQRWRQIIGEEDYWAMLETVRGIEPTLSLHSFRKGAIQFLQHQGRSEAEIALLTQHRLSRGMKVQGLQAYVTGTMADADSKKILEMTDQLCAALV
jgi:hypothetical protein